MRLIKPSFEVIEQQSGLEGIYEMIELAGRTCYKSSSLYRWYSEDKTKWINENSEEWKFLNIPKKEYPIKGENISAKGFVERMIKSGHGAMLEHGTIYLYLPWVSIGGIDAKYSRNKYSKSVLYSNIVCNKDGNSSFIPIEYGKAGHYITTNMRVLVENNWLEDLKYICEPTEYHEKRVCVRFICDRGVSHEYVRHRVFSFAQESTRYCNYSKNRFSNEVTFIIPCWTNILEGKYTNMSKQSTEDGEYKQIMLHENNINAYPLTTTPEGRFLWNCYWSEHDYFDLLEQGWKPQQARAVLPNALKTELIMTGFVSDWKHFFELRDAGSAHPQAQELAKPLHEEFIKRNYI